MANFSLHLGMYANVVDQGGCELILPEYTYIAWKSLKKDVGGVYWETHEFSRKML